MRRSTTTIIGIFVLLTLAAGCSPLPTRIDPKPVPVVGYTSKSCSDLLALRTADVHRLHRADVEQRAVRRSDTWGVLLLGLPVGRMAGGNRADEIATLKGDVIAINTAYRDNHCGGTPTRGGRS